MNREHMVERICFVAHHQHRSMRCLSCKTFLDKLRLHAATPAVVGSAGGALQMNVEIRNSFMVQTLATFIFR